MNPFRTAILLALLTISIASCGRVFSYMTNSISGDGNITSETRHPAAFSQVKLEGAYDVILTQGPSTEIRIETDRNLLAHITTDVKDGKLVVSSDQNLQPSKSLKVYVSSPNFDLIDLAGAGDISAATPITSNDLKLALSGAGDYKLEVHTARLTTNVSGAGDMTLTGTAGSVSASIAGTGDFKGKELAVDTMEVSLSGAANAQVNVAKKLEASVAGAGDVTYTGAVTDVHSNVSGAGSVNRAKD